MNQKELISRANIWTTEVFDAVTQKTAKNMIENNHEELQECFYKDLEFGTGGLRGIMGVGTNRINIYTVGLATQGLANYVKQSFKGEHTSIAIAHDSRNNSRLFAEKSAEILSANGIKVYLFDSLRPTPMLSFAVRHYGCNAGIVITASHNPREYNGYKVYWDDGGQLVPPHDKNVITEVRKVSVADINFNANKTLIETVGEDFDQIYINKLKTLSCQQYFENEGSDLKIVFTSIHGTGITVVPEALSQFGFKAVTIVEEQAKPNGDFPTVVYPNPEEREALSIAIEKAKSIDADIVFGTDPDADRVGMVVKHKGEFEILNGNQAGTLLVYFLLKKWKEDGKLKGKEFIAKTIVTSQLIDKVSAGFNTKCFNTLTGFKYIAELIKEHEGKLQFIGGGEESYGYLAGDFVRDKDAVISTLLLSEVAAWSKEQNKTLIDILKEIYLAFGFYKEHLISITKKGISGAEEIAAMMEKFRTNTPETINNIKVVELRDYKLNTIKDITSGTISPTGLPSSNVIQFSLQDGSLITARPSGTEPKIKFYISVNSKLDSIEDYDIVNKELTTKIEQLSEFLSA
jgi:phosphoglucomutase